MVETQRGRGRFRVHGRVKGRGRNIELGFSASNHNNAQIRKSNNITNNVKLENNHQHKGFGENRVILKVTME